MIKGRGVENTKITIGMLLHWMYSSLVSVASYLEIDPVDLDSHLCAISDPTDPRLDD